MCEIIQKCEIQCEPKARRTLFSAFISNEEIYSSGASTCITCILIRFRHGSSGTSGRKNKSGKIN